LQSAATDAQVPDIAGLTTGTPGGAEGALKIAPENAPANVPADRDLQAVANAWPTLPAAVRAGIMAMIRAVG
jgi:hypothetical protein